MVRGRSPREIFDNLSSKNTRNYREIWEFKMHSTVISNTSTLNGQFCFLCVLLRGIALFPLLWEGWKLWVWKKFWRFLLHPAKKMTPPPANVPLKKRCLTPPHTQTHCCWFWTTFLYISKFFSYNNNQVIKQHLLHQKNRCMNKSFHIQKWSFNNKIVESLW